MKNEGKNMKFNNKEVIGIFKNGIATKGEIEHHYEFHYPIEQFKLKDNYWEEYSGDVWTEEVDGGAYIGLLFIDKDGLCFRNGDETVEDIAEILYDEFIEECCEDGE